MPGKTDANVISLFPPAPPPHRPTRPAPPRQPGARLPRALAPESRAPPPGAPRAPVPTARTPMSRASHHLGAASVPPRRPPSQCPRAGRHLGAPAPARHLAARPGAPAPSARPAPPPSGAARRLASLRLHGCTSVCTAARTEVPRRRAEADRPQIGTGCWIVAAVYISVYTVLAIDSVSPGADDADVGRPRSAWTAASSQTPAAAVNSRSSTDPNAGRGRRWPTVGDCHPGNKRRRRPGRGRELVLRSVVVYARRCSTRRRVTWRNSRQTRNGRRPRGDYCRPGQPAGTACLPRRSPVRHPHRPSPPPFQPARQRRSHLGPPSTPSTRTPGSART